MHVSMDTSNRKDKVFAHTFSDGCFARNWPFQAAFPILFNYFSVSQQVSNKLTREPQRDPSNPLSFSIDAEPTQSLNELLQVGLHPRVRRQPADIAGDGLHKAATSVHCCSLLQQPLEASTTLSRGQGLPQETRQAMP